VGALPRGAERIRLRGGSEHRPRVATVGREGRTAPDLAAELVRLKVDVIVAAGNPAIAAAQKATRTIPIVMVLALDPAELAARSRLPAIGIIRWFPEAGGLLSYGGRDSDRFQRAAHYVDRLLKGAKPAELPIEQPTKFELVINMKTAKRLGVTVPQSLLRQADLVIE
jgi:ABC-type uncharacterized transport system substrate-binding protein